MRDRFHSAVWSSLFFFCMLAACSILPTRDTNPLKTYVLSPDLSQMHIAAVSPATKDIVLLVSVPRAQAGLDTQRMAYLSESYLLSYYAHSQWADVPSRLLAPLLVGALEQQPCCPTVVQMPAAIRADYRLDTEVLHWQQEFLTQPSRIRGTLRAQLVAIRSQRVLAVKQFEVLAPAASEDAHGGVVALNRALPQLLEQLGEWVNTQLLGDSETLVSSSSERRQ